MARRRAGGLSPHSHAPPSPPTERASIPSIRTIADAPVSRGRVHLVRDQPTHWRTAPRLHAQRELGGLFGGWETLPGTATRAAASEAGPRVGLGGLRRRRAVRKSQPSPPAFSHPLLAVYPMGPSHRAFPCRAFARLPSTISPSRRRPKTSRSHLPSRLDQFFLYDANFNYHPRLITFPASAVKSPRRRQPPTRRRVLRCRHAVRFDVRYRFRFLAQAAMNENPQLC